MLIIILVVIGLSLLILGHEAGHFFAAKIFGLKVDEFGFGFPPRMFAWKRGDTEYSLNWLPFGGFVRIAGERGEFEMIDTDGSEGSAAAPDPKAASRLLYAQPVWKKSLVMLAGVIVNFILGWIFVSATFMIGAPQAVIIQNVQTGSPAAQAGLLSGDILKDYAPAQGFIDFVNAHKGQPVVVNVFRNNKTITVTTTPRIAPPPGQGALGVELAEGGTPREGFFVALWDGLRGSAAIVWLTVGAFYQLVKELFVHATLLPGVVGPVGIFGMAEETGKIGLAYLLQFIGVISLNLTVVNLIPFPALDGGRFLLGIVEKIKGSPLSYKVESRINSLGFALLLILMVLLTVRDVQGLL